MTLSFFSSLFSAFTSYPVAISKRNIQLRADGIAPIENRPIEGSEKWSAPEFVIRDSRWQLDDRPGGGISRFSSIFIISSSPIPSLLISSFPNFVAIMRSRFSGCIELAASSRRDERTAAIVSSFRSTKVRARVIGATTRSKKERRPRHILYLRVCFCRAVCVYACAALVRRAEPSAVIIPMTMLYTIHTEAE